ncbi:hypothetical protein [Lysinibacillus pakistanensis]|uniref:Uncharacterized protein n=1 Tax=Lysinibacillus pakistanensis TaxID=759811 RepID=A0AAX3WWD7_9BACI|nr:hypothetical protein [Lysinibacillus pakistanensis]MDM5231461.1 hypothetical protein [Lysinibacillus pakistanensis]WHY47008.1 hypothetical protein QNH22_01970 [Lysinibacillus pakistanensis]WHY52020.1 hypothetical protein QNH24_01965 [Lysinibacillus pakistanensis]
MNAEMLEKRREILKQIDALLPKCDCVTAVESESCSNCKKIAKYGQKLLRLINKRTKLNSSIDIARVKSSELPLTKAKYLGLKKEGKIDEKIAEMLNVSSGALQNWKRSNGIAIRTNRKRLKA